MRGRYTGCLLGLACGDALGTTVEFMPRGRFLPVVDMIGGGPFGLKPGEWTDDTSMALCLAVSMLEKKGHDPLDQAERYCRWRDEGYLSSNGRCFDIGNTVAASLSRFEQSGDPNSGSVSPRSAGNGSIMRLAPVPMYYLEDLGLVARYSAESSLTTHGTREAVDGCRLFGVMIARALKGESKESLLFGDIGDLIGEEPLAPKIAAIAAGAYRRKDESAIRGSGYVVASLEAALWSFYRTDSYREAVLTAVNLGDDADTTAAVCGQLAGAYYGIEGIPEPWRAMVAQGQAIETIALRLHDERWRPSPGG